MIVFLFEITFVRIKKTFEYKRTKGVGCVIENEEINAMYICSKGMFESQHFLAFFKVCTTALES